MPDRLRTTRLSRLPFEENERCKADLRRGLVLTRLSVSTFAINGCGTPTDTVARAAPRAGRDSRHHRQGRADDDPSLNGPAGAD